MQVTNQLLLEAAQVVEGIASVKMKPEGSAFLAILRARRLLRAEAEVVEETRQTLLDQHAKTDDNGNRVLGTDGRVVLTNSKAFNEQWRNLLKEACEISFEAVTLKEFGAKFELTVVEVDVLQQVGIVSSEGEDKK